MNAFPRDSYELTVKNCWGGKLGNHTNPYKGLIHSGFIAYRHKLIRTLGIYTERGR